MKLLDIMNSPWMITTDYHRDMAGLYASRLKSEKLDFKELEKAFNERGETSRRNEKGLLIKNGFALIDVKGPLTKESSFFSFFFNGRSMKGIQEQLVIADQSPEVDKKILIFDTPGGTVDGGFELEEFVRESNAIKPIISFSDGMIASLGYLLASATSKIVITGKTNPIGSIGVISRKSDWTEYDAKLGIKFDEYVSGVYKNIYSPDRVTDEFVSKAIQETVNYLATLFIEQVASNRSPDKQALINLQANVLIGQQALDFGLADEIGTLESLIGEDISGVSSVQNGGGLSSAGKQPEKIVISTTKNLENKKMDKAELKLKDPELYQSIVTEGKAAVNTESITEGERVRISTIQGMGFPGQEDLISELVKSGASVEEAAVKINGAEKAKQEIFKGKILNETIEPVKIETTVDNQQLNVKPKAETVNDNADPKEVWKNDAALRSEFNDNLAVYEAFLQAEGNGQVRIFGQ